MNIRPATEADFDRMFDIFQTVVAAGETYVFDAGVTRADAFAYWFAPGIRSFVAEAENRIVGMYKLTANQRDRGSHVANASFMVDPGYAGCGTGKVIGLHCLREAQSAGFMAMQFNFVVSTNQAAVSLWRKLGFSIVGTLPKAFRHRRLGYVDAYVMYRFLDDAAV
ncbi:MAG: GNAT family N-acetyltransferase [Gammaproteobacteria bacterium]